MLLIVTNFTAKIQEKIQKGPTIFKDIKHRKVTSQTDPAITVYEGKDP